jgi:flavin-binding protein dodecin
MTELDSLISPKNSILIDKIHQVVLMKGGEAMSVVKVVELVGESPDGWKDAIDQAVAKASETIHNIKGVEIKNFTAKVEDGRVIGYKADMSLAFRVDD